MLVRACGGSVIASGKYRLAATAGNEDIAWCLASNNGRSTPKTQTRSDSKVVALIMAAETNGANAN
jgi:hypothetical protein